MYSKFNLFILQKSVGLMFIVMFITLSIHAQNISSKNELLKKTTTTQFNLDSVELMKVRWQKLITNHPFYNRPYKTKSEWKKLPKKDRPDLAMEQNTLMTMDPAIGEVPAERLTLAHQEANSILSTKAPIAGVQWTERGPNNVGGRTRALMFDPNDVNHKKVWAAGVGGGLWYTNDITASTPVWNHVNDLWDNIAISCITYNPANTQEMYVGTGEGFFNGGAQRGGGIWKTTDGGASWNLLSATNPGAYNSNSDFHYITKMVVKNNGYVFATTRGYFTNRGGVMRSTDGGATWSKVLSIYVSGSFNDFASDIEVAANGDLYCSFGIFSAAKVLKSLNTNHGASGTWTDLSTNIGMGAAERIELACAPSNHQVVYAVASGGSGNQDVEWIKKSNDGGSTWSTLSIPLMIDGTGSHFTRSQSWYDLIMAVHPSDENTILVGGIDLHRSTDGGTNWTGISHWYGGFGEPEVHADQHAMAFRPGSSNEVIFGNDGGVYYSVNAGNTSSNPSFEHRNYGYNVTQFYACATKNEVNSNYFLAGAQDNGTQKFTQSQMNATSEVTGGDGAFCHIDQLNSNIQITQYTNNNFYRSTDGGLTFPSIISEGSGHFINPSEYDSQFKILFAAANADQLKRVTSIDGTFNNADIPLSLGGAKISSLKKSTYSDVLFIGVSNGRVYKLTNASSGSPTLTRIDNGSSPITSTGWVSSIDVGANDNQLLITYSNFGVISLWETNNGGSNWNNKEGNLPDMPIRWALYNPDNRDQVILATEVGVWSTDNFQPGSNAAPVWGPSNVGLAHTRCDMLKYRPADKMVLVATHGRGLYTTDIFVTTSVADFAANTQSTCGGSLNVQFVDGSLRPQNDWQWDVNNDGVIDYTSQNPSHLYSSPGLYSPKLIINGGASSIIKPNYIWVGNAAPTASIGCTISPNSNAGNGFGLGIELFQLENINHSSDINDGHYLDYTCTDWTTLRLNTTYNVSVKTSTTNSEGARVYIDYNDNGIFETGESVVSFPSNLDGFRTLSFTTPSSGVTLNKGLRLRVLSRFNSIPSNACNVSTYGQAEDYTVYFLPNPNAVLMAGTGSTNICNGQSTNLKVNITGGIPPYVVKIDDGSGAQTFSNYYSGTDIPINPTTTTTYTLNSVTDAINESVSTSGSVLIQVTNPSTNTSNISACDTYTWSVNNTTYTQSGAYQVVNGCQTEILNLILTPSTSQITVDTTCDSYFWSINNMTYTQSGIYTYVNGCHTETLYLTVTPSTTNTTTISSCDTYSWSLNNTAYTQSGIYNSVNGCHTEVLNLTITPSTTNTTTISSCDTYTWSLNNTAYTQSGIYSSVNGCHTEILDLTITSSTTNTTTIAACDSYTWSVNNTAYTQSGIYSSVNGCHTEILDLTITPSTTNTTTIAACDTYTWSVNNMAYTQSGIYNSVNGCHTEILNLTITPSSLNSNTVSACGSYTWSQNNVTYTQSGTYSTLNNCHTEELILTITAQPACQNGGTVNVNCGCDCPSGYYGFLCENAVCNPTFGNSSLTACDSYLWNGNLYTNSGIYTGLFVNAAGCDSTHTLNLTITPSTTNTTTIAACDVYTWSVNNTAYTQSGIYSSVNGCHTEILDLTITPSTTNTTTIAACDTYTWSVNNTAYSQSGIYSSVNGCHTENLNLTITPSTTNTTTITSCDTYTWSVNNTAYTQSGIYNSVNGCHTEVLNLTITPSSLNSNTVSACGSYTWSQNNVTYTQSGTYSTLNNCHTEELILTITAQPACQNGGTVNVNCGCDCPSGYYGFLCENAVCNPSFGNSSLTACDSYLWNGNLYTNSGIYTGLFVNAAGCDSTHTLNLTITPSTTNTTTIAACDTYTWSVNNTAYTQSGIYSSVSGCHTEVLNLTITPSTTNTTTIAACDTYTWSVNNTAYTQSGIYSSVNGCHTEVLNLTITPSTTNTTTISSCDTYTWSVNNTAYTQSGIYSSVNGCHTEILNLTITPSTTNTTTITSCDTYTWSVNNMAYTQSGIYSSVNGCHTEVLNLTITPSTTNTTTITSCDTYTWSVNNMAYTQSGIYSSVNGCHTEILDLTITTNVTNTSVQSACGTYFWPVNNMTYTQSGTYTYVNGCQNEVLILTIFGLPAVTASDVSACAGQAVNLMGYPAGGVFSVSNPYIGPSTTYTYTYTDNNGCIATSVPANIYISNAPPVTGVTISNIGANTATVNWNSVPGLIWYEIRYRTVGSASWTGGGTQAAPTNFKNIIGLMAGTSYEIEVRGFCTNNASAPGPWSTTSLFATSAACPSPQNLSTSNVTKNSATLQWTAVPNANYYQIRYRLASGPGAWISGGTASGLAVSKNIIGLSASTQYEWQIRANCNPAPFSTGSWSVLDDFTTLANKPGQTDILNTNFENHVQIYPNPVQDQLNVELQLNESAAVAIMIFDMQGRMVYQVQSHLLEGLQNVSVDVSNFAKGVYQLKVFANKELISIGKFTKQD
jgi:hypothetical protein